MRSNITRGWLIEMPDVISHSHAVQPVIAVPKRASINHPPRPVRDNLSRTDTLVFDPFRSFAEICEHDPDPHLSLRYFAGSGSGVITGGELLGDLLGGGDGRTGSAVGDTGSSSGMTVYRLIG